MKQNSDNQINHHTHPDGEPINSLERPGGISDSQIRKGDDSFDQGAVSSNKPDKVLDKLEEIWDLQTRRGDEDPIEYQDFSKSDQEHNIDTEERAPTKRVRNRIRPMM